MINTTTVQGTSHIERGLFHSVLGETAPDRADLAAVRAQIDSMGERLDYERTVLMLSTLGFSEEAVRMMSGIGPTKAKMHLVASNTPPPHHEALVWPGDLTIEGRFSFGLLVVGGNLTIVGDVEALVQRVDGRVRRFDAIVAPTIFSPTVIDIDALPAVGRA